MYLDGKKNKKVISLGSNMPVFFPLAKEILGLGSKKTEIHNGEREEYIKELKELNFDEKIGQEIIS